MAVSLSLAVLLCAATLRGVTTQTLSGCGSGDYKARTATSGTITSKNFPSNYDNSLTCEWSINTLTSTKRTKIKFNAATNFGTGDSLKIYSGTSATGTPTVQKTGAGTAEIFIINSRYLYVVFESDASNVASGFSFTWSTTSALNATLSGCGDESYKYHQYSSGSIKTKNYPSDYDNSLNCYWYIDTAATTSTRLWFTTFKTETKNDILTVYKGIDMTSGTRVATYSGEYTFGFSLYVTGRYVFIHFQSNAATTMKGFSVNWYTSIFSGSGCAGKRYSDGASGSIQSPNYPNPYLPKSSCYWQITGTIGQDLSLSFASPFKLEAGTTSCYDYIRILKGTVYSIFSTNLVGKFCGSTKPDSIIVEGNEVLVYFYSESDHEYAGFKIDWSSRAKPSSTPSGYYTTNSYVYGSSTYSRTSAYRAPVVRATVRLSVGSAVGSFFGKPATALAPSCTTLALTAVVALILSQIYKY